MKNQKEKKSRREKIKKETEKPERSILGEEWPATAASERCEREELKRLGYTDQGLTDPWEGEGPDREEENPNRRKAA